MPTGWCTKSQSRIWGCEAAEAEAEKSVEKTASGRFLQRTSFVCALFLKEKSRTKPDKSLKPEVTETGNTYSGGPNAHMLQSHVAP